MVIGAGIGALGAIGGGIMGAFTNQSNINNQWAMLMYNARQQRKAQEEQRAYAESIRNEQKLGSTDAFGSRSRFIDGQGWVTELGEMPRSLLNYFLNEELPAMRDQFKRTNDRNMEEDLVADSLLREFGQIRKQDPAQIQALLNDQSLRGVNEATKETTSAAMRSALRQGNSNIGKIISEIGKAAMETHSNAKIDNQLRALDYAENLYNNQRGNSSQLYNLFAALSQEGLQPTVDAIGIADGANSMTGANRQMLAQGNSMGFNSASQMPMQMQAPQDNGAWASALSGGLQAIGSVFDRHSAQQQLQQQNNLLMQYFQQSGQMPFATGGIMGMNNRNLGNTKGF